MKKSYRIGAASLALATLLGVAPMEMTEVAAQTETMEAEAAVSTPTVQPITPSASIIVGKADESNAVTVTFADGTELTGVANRWGNYNLPVAEGTSIEVGDTITIVATNAEDESSAPLEYVVPDPLEATQLTVNPILPEGAHEGISGTAVPGASVTVHLPGNSSMADQADADGNWFINTRGFGNRLTPGTEVTVSVAISGISHRNVGQYTVEEAAASEVIELPRPDGLKHQRLPHGTTIQVEDFVTNLDAFPEGTTFEFYDYEIGSRGDSILLDVSPNPTSRNERLVIRATHPQAEAPSDSFSFTVVIQKEETVAAPTYNPVTPLDHYVSGQAEAGNTVTITLGDDTELTGEANARGQYEIYLPEERSFEIGETFSVTQSTPAGTVSEATEGVVQDPAVLTELVVNPIEPGAATITGSVIPGASVTVWYPNGGQRGASVASDGTWTVRNFNHASDLTPGDTVRVHVRKDGKTYRYDNHFTVAEATPEEVVIDEEASSLRLARLGYYYARYYRVTVTLVDEAGEPVTGLTAEDFNVLGYGGIANFEAVGNEYRIDTEYADDLRTGHTMSIEDGIVTVTLEENQTADVEESKLIVARLGYSGDRYYRLTATMVDENGNPMYGLTADDFNVLGFGGIANFEAVGNEYRIDTETADELRPAHSLVMVDGVITIAVGDEEAVEFESTYRANPELKYGERVTVQEGQTGAIVDGVVIREAVEEIVEVGNVMERFQNEPFYKEYIADNTLGYGEELVLEAGNPGSYLLEHVWEVNPETGRLFNRSEGVVSEVMTEAKNRVIGIGNIQSETTELAYETVREVDYDLAPGEERVVQAGVVGHELVTTTYEVDSSTGELVSPVVETETQDAVDEIIAYGVELAEVSVDPVKEGDNSVILRGTPGAEVGIRIDKGGAPAVQLFAVQLANVAETFVATIGADGEFVYSPADYVAEAGDVITVTWVGGDGRVLAEFAVEAAAVEEPGDSMADELAALEQRLAALEEIVRQLAAENEALLADLAVLEADLAAADEVTAGLEAQVAALEARVAELENVDGGSESEDAVDDVVDEPVNAGAGESEEVDSEVDAAVEEEVSAANSKESNPKVVEAVGAEDQGDTDKLPQTGSAAVLSTIGLGLVSLLSGIGLRVFGKKND